jgi:hypothetical protein
MEEVGMNDRRSEGGAGWRRDEKANFARGGVSLPSICSTDTYRRKRKDKERKDMM